MQCIGAVGLRVRWVVVNFEEDTVDSGGYGGAGEDWDELGRSEEIEKELQTLKGTTEV